jgi:hypothetical protein
VRFRALIIAACIVVHAIAAPAALAQRLSVESQPAAATRAALPPGFHAYQTAHYLILSDAGRVFAQRQGEHLERAHHQFARFCARLGLEPGPQRHKLVVAAFRDREAYRRFAQRHDGVADAALAGYYAPVHDRVVLYDVQSNPSVQQAQGKLNEMRLDLRSLEQRIRAAEATGLTDEVQSLRGMKRDYQEHLGRQEERVGRFMAQTATATVIHEAIHQLLFHSGIQRSDIEYPMWISEGLASAFETDTPAGSFGPDRDYQPRRSEFRRLLQQGALRPLEDLITVAQETHMDHDCMGVIYHQSYALVCWLVRERPEALRRYLELLRREGPAGAGPRRWRHAFVEAFGEVEAVEAEWLAAERG